MNKVGTGKYGEQTVLGVLADGDYFGDQALVETDGSWEFTAKAATGVHRAGAARHAFQERGGPVRVAARARRGST